MQIVEYSLWVSLLYAGVILAGLTIPMRLVTLR